MNENSWTIESVREAHHPNDVEDTKTYIAGNCGLEDAFVNEGKITAVTEDLMVPFLVR